MASVTDVFTGSGKHTLNNGTGGCWHVLSSTGSNYEGLLASVQIRCTRDTDSTTITIHDGWISSSLYNPYSARYGYPITWGLVRGGTITSSHNASDTDNYCVVGGTPILSEQLSNTGGGGTRSFDPNNPSTHLTFTSSTNETLRLCFLCGQSGGCQQGYSGSSSSPYSEWVVIADIDTSRIPYNPYSAPSISLNSNKDLGVYNKNNDYWVKYTITAGTAGIVRTVLEILNPNNNNVLQYYGDLSITTGSEQTYTYTITSGNCGHGGYYKARLAVQDGTSTIYSSLGNIHTCHYPLVSDLNLWTNGSSSATTITSFSPQNTSVEFWWTQDNNNNSLWTGENAETNELRTYTGSTKHSLNPGNNNRSIAMSTSNINTLFPTSERNADSLTKTVTIARYHSQIPVTVTATRDITLQLKPTKTPNGFDILNTSDQSIKSTVQGQLVNKNTYASVKLKWNYPYTDIAAGVISGYRIQIYTNSSYTTQFGSNIDYDTTSYSNVKYTLNVKTQCKSLVMNYVKITPYYKDGNGTKRLGSNYLTATLFSPYGNILTPTISYPINNTTWHNRNFRVLFQLPEDEDYDSSQASSYRYNDIEIYVYGYTDLISQTYDYTWASYSFMYSTSTLSYQKKIVINPSLTSTSNNLSLGGLGNYSHYRIKVRVAKTVNGNKVWSSWSNEVTVHNSELEPLEAGGEDYLAIYQELNEILNESDNYSGTGNTNINIYNELNTILDESDSYSGGGQGTITVGGIIRASHYNTIRDYSERLRAVYSPLATEDITNTQVQVGDIINHEKYLKIYNTIKRIQSSVNGYATFDNDRNNVKFNQTISLLDGNNTTARGEIITAERDLRPGSGRDYLLLLYDSMSLLY